MRIVVADDHELVRRGLRELLTRVQGVDLCGEAATGREAVEVVKKLKPDVVIMDISMPELNGLDATRQILQVSPQTQVLILSMHKSDQLVWDVLNSGARGYVLKTDAGSELVEALAALRRRSLYFSPEITDTVLDLYLKGPARTANARQPPTLLSGREREIVQLLAEGKANKEVATILRLSVTTVETHRSHIMRKLNLHSLSALVRYAIRNRIVEP